MKVSASTAFFGSSNPDLVKFYKEARIDALELSSLSAAELLRYDFCKLIDACDDYEVECRSLHLPFSQVIDITNPNPELRELSESVSRYGIRQAGDYGIPYCVIHPSSEPIADEERPTRLRLCKAALNRLTAYADACGVTLLVENLPRTCLCNTPEATIALIKEVPGLGCCFDTNHFLPQGGLYPDNAGFIRSMGKELPGRLLSLHVSDYDFIDERHIFPGEGLNDWEDIISALTEIGYTGYLNYEVCGAKGGINSGRSLKQVRENADRLLGALA